MDEPDLCFDSWAWDRYGGAWLTIGDPDEPIHHWHELVDEEHGHDTGNHMVLMARCLAEAGYGGGRVTVGISHPSIWATNAEGDDLPADVVERAHDIATLSGRRPT